MAIELTVENMTCGGCVRSVTNAVRRIDPKARVVADVAKKCVSVDSTAGAQVILQAVTAAGFPARLAGHR